MPASTRVQSWTGMAKSSARQPSKRYSPFYITAKAPALLFAAAEAVQFPFPTTESLAMKIQGIIPPVATPMQANEDLDLPRLKWFIDHLISQGVHGIFVLGTNSEFYALDEREKQEVVAAAVAHVNRRVPVFAGTGAETTREVVRLTKMA